MAGFSTGLKQLLTITACTLDTSGNLNPQAAKKFEVMMNPSGFSHAHSISYSESASDSSSKCNTKKKKPLGQPAVEPKFYTFGPEKVSFDLVIDGTGVVNLPIPGIGSPPVKDQIKQLKEIAYAYEGKEHEPNIVQLLWGPFTFYGRLESMSLDYTLFKPSGEPLRAKVKLSFVNFMSKAEQALRANKSSPDLTHIVEVKAGETLPLLCHRIYKDSSYYVDVAKANNIVNFRDIQPGTKLHFPPLK